MVACVIDQPLLNTAACVYLSTKGCLSADDGQVPYLTNLAEGLSGVCCDVVVSTESDPVGVGDGAESTESEDVSIGHGLFSIDGNVAGTPCSIEEMFDGDATEYQDEEENEGDIDDEEDEGCANDQEDERLYGHHKSKIWLWLRTFRTEVKGNIDGKMDEQIASCRACPIHRKPIRKIFYTKMKEPNQDLADLAFAVLDRWGFLKTDIMDHPIKKGSGVWGNELDESKILVIEYLNLDGRLRRQGIAKKLFEDIWQRATGFRRIGMTQWFCLAADTDHSAADLASQDDFDPPQTLFSIGALPLHDALDAIINPKDMNPNARDHFYPWLVNEPMKTATLELLNGYLSSHSRTDPNWTATDRDGNTILHLLAKPRLLKPLQWIRNHNGDTPAEAFACELEKTRTELGFGARRLEVSDMFDGYREDEVECLLKLRGLINPSDMDKAQATFGCTCGMCLGGISPRMGFALECQVRLRHHAKNRIFRGDISGECWCSENYLHLEHLAPRVRRQLEINEFMRQGVTNLFRHIADCLRQKQVPTTLNMLHVLEAAGEWPPNTKNFLQRGGTVAALMQVCFELAGNDDRYLGDGSHEKDFQPLIDELPTCRNDREFLFAMRVYTMIEEGRLKMPPSPGRGWIDVSGWGGDAPVWVVLLGVFPGMDCI
ncbi:hypothetical protein MMC26_003656 [Xylographa opegraphella]|nr:hypothetical protein [Xylographa opegraphella]